MSEGLILSAKGICNLKVTNVHLTEMSMFPIQGPRWWFIIWSIRNNLCGEVEKKTGTPGFCIITLVGTLYLGRADKFFYGGGKKKYWGFLGKEGE
jgi:hypothetical protein